jgi:hypothetical protein
MSINVKFTIVKLEKYDDNSIEFIPDNLNWQIPIISLVLCALTKDLFIEIRFHDNGLFENLESITAYAKIVESTQNKYSSIIQKVMDEDNINCNMQLNYCESGGIMLRYPLHCFRRTSHRLA